MSSKLVLFDDQSWSQLLPLTFTKPVSELRIGTSSIREKWTAYFHDDPSYFCTAYLQEKYPFQLSLENIFVNSSILPNPELVTAINALEYGEGLVDAEDLLLAFKYQQKEGQVFSWIEASEKQKKIYKGAIVAIRKPEDIFLKNDLVIRSDVAKGLSFGKAVDLHPSNTLIGNELYVAEGAQILGATINTETGPVIVDKNALVMEGALLRGPLYIGESAVIKMGAKVYGATTLGPFVKVGGEISNVVIQGYSNKGHDGFLGNSVIGEWCNLGADTNASNLKNNYGEIRIWSYAADEFVNTGQQFCGLIMGDHSKSAINTQFNTGTVVGCGANVFCTGFPEKHIPSFAWLGDDTKDIHKLEKMMETVERVMKRRSLELNEVDRKILKAIFERTEKYRSQLKYA